MRIKKILEYKIIFDNGNSLEDYHDQDCCEDVYADFKNLQVLTKIGANSINSDILDFDEDLLANIKLMKDVGFILKDKNGIELFVSCYNRQNGYYSSNLELIYKRKITIEGSEERLDISNCVEDDIY